jgi:4-diphosphocytidyl-2-C-methyl-D-erythritol kinase
MPLLTQTATHDTSTDRMERRRHRIRPVIVRAYAKINLDLRVLGTRPDGFHELRTVFQSISLHDTVACIPREGPFAIDCSAAGVPLDRSNLIWRAAEALWRALRRSGPIRDVGVRLEKQIPLQAGLGGGSADAAAALVGLARTWGVPLRPAQLIDVAATLGADVPRHWVVVLVPGFGVSTSEAYGWYDAERDLARGPILREPQHVPGPWPSRSAQMINDLEVPIARHHPEIDQMKAALRRAGAAAAAMSGSGSAVFGLFQKRSDALAAGSRLDGSGWRVLLS